MKDSRVLPWAGLALLPMLAMAQQATPRVSSTIRPLANQDYVAHVADRAFAGSVALPGITWTCAKGQCRTRAPWRAPSVDQCRPLADRVGTVTRFGTGQVQLDAAQLATCNSKPLAKTPSVVAPVTGRMTANVLTPAMQAERTRRQQQFQALRGRIGKLAVATPAPGPRAATPPAGYVKTGQGKDCDDSSREVHPLAPEVCDHRDNDCDGAVDENQTLRFFLDADGDGHGDPAQPVDACPMDQVEAVNSGRWLVLTPNDCDDTDPARWRDCP